MYDITVFIVNKWWITGKNVFIGLIIHQISQFAKILTGRVSYDLNLNVSMLQNELKNFGGQLLDHLNLACLRGQLSTKITADLALRYQ